MNLKGTHSDYSSYICHFFTLPLIIFLFPLKVKGVFGYLSPNPKPSSVTCLYFLFVGWFFKIAVQMCQGLGASSITEQSATTLMKSNYCLNILNKSFLQPVPINGSLEWKPASAQLYRKEIGWVNKARWHLHLRFLSPFESDVQGVINCLLKSISVS